MNETKLALAAMVIAGWCSAEEADGVLIRISVRPVPDSVAGVLKDFEQALGEVRASAERRRAIAAT